MNSQMYPKYSVLMSVYYKEKPEWLDCSINSMMNQIVSPSEFVIVEDGPLNENLDKVIESYVRKYPEIFKIVKIETNKGLGLALQRGILECENEFIARMDSDDYSCPERIKKQFEIFNKFPDLDLVGTNVNEFEKDINEISCSVILPETHDKIYRFSKKKMSI